MEAVTRHDQILANFLAYHKENPQMWELFRRYALIACRSGRRKTYGAQMIMERARWHSHIETVDPSGVGLKINNDHAAFYSRMFILDNPDKAEFFHLRKLRSLYRPAVNGKEDIDRTPPTPGEEDELNEILERLL